MKTIDWVINKISLWTAK